MRNILTNIILTTTVFTSTVFASTIEEIEYKNLTFLSPNTAATLIDITKGEEFDEKSVDRAIRELFSQGYFKDIWVDFDDKTLVFNFIEKPSIAKIDIKGYKNNQDEVDEFLDTLGIKKGDIYDVYKIEQIKEKFLEALNLDGKLDSVIEVEVNEINESSVELLFVVNQGETITINELDLRGNKQIPTEEIKTVLVNKDRDPIWGWMWGFDDGKLHLEQLDIDSARLKDYYLQKGYLDADVKSPLLNVDFNDYSALLSLDIVEGKPYINKSVSLEYVNSEEVIAVETLTAELKLKQDELFNVNNLRADLQKLKNLIADKGYAYARIIPDVKQNRAESNVEVTYKIESGEKVYINDIIISGNSATIDRVIRREIFLAPGDLYSLSELNDSKNALGRTGYFETTDIQEKRISSDKIDLIVKVKEAPTGNIMLGGGYGSYDGFMINASVSDRNIFGSGINVGLSVDQSERSQRYNFSISNPRLNDSTYSAAINFFWNNYESYDDIDLTYANESKGGYISIGKRINRYLSSSMSFNYVNTDITDFTDTAEGSDSYTKGSIAPSFTFNNTDDYYVPRSGIYATTSFEFAGIGGDTAFIKNYSTFQTFFGLKEYIDYDLVLRAKLRGGAIMQTGYTPTSERFFLGGVRNVRGYNYSSIRPTSTFSKDGEDITIYGGAKTFSGSLEASIPLIESARMRLTFFYDQGIISNTWSNFMNVAGTGAVIEWFAPIGPVNFVFSRALSDDYKDYESVFEFTIGQRF